MNDLHELTRAYEGVAEIYAKHPENDLQKKPYDRARLDVVIGSAIDNLPILDLGAGPGQSARYLAERGRAVIAVDACEEMTRRTRAAHSSIEVRHADFRTL